MTDQRYTIVFEGRLQPGQAQTEVQTRLAKLFNLDAATAGQLFSGRPMIKRNLTPQQAQQYQRAFQQAGALCRVAPQQAGTQAPRPAAQTQPVVPQPRQAPPIAPPLRQQPPPVSPGGVAPMAAAGPGSSMQCPKCGRSQPAASECAFCGVVVSKIATAAPASSPTAFDTAPPSPFAVPAPAAAPAPPSPFTTAPAMPGGPGGYAAPTVVAPTATAPTATAPTAAGGHPRDVIAQYQGLIRSDRIFLAPNLPADRLPEAMLPFRSDHASWPNDEAFILDPEEEILAVMISDIRLKNSISILVLTDQKLLHAMTSGAGAHSCMGFLLADIDRVQITGQDQDRLMVGGRELHISDTSSHDQQARVQLATMLQAVATTARSLPPMAAGGLAPGWAVKIGQVHKARESAGDSGGGFFAPEKKGLQAGVVGGLVMMAIGAVWFYLAWQAGYIFPWSLVLVVLGAFGVIKGLFQGNWAG